MSQRSDCQALDDEKLAWNGFCSHSSLRTSLWALVIVAGRILGKTSPQTPPILQTSTFHDQNLRFGTLEAMVGHPNTGCSDR